MEGQIYKALFKGKYTESEIEYFYSDSIFGDADKKYIQELAELSAAEMILYNYGEPEDFCSATGFGGLRQYTHDEDDIHKSNFMITSKKLKDFTVVNVAIHGTKGREWFSNFDIYEAPNKPSEVHFGFKCSADYVYESLCRYIEEEGIMDNIFFWLTGHSRGAAAANLLANRIESEGIRVAAYTIATPNVTTKPCRSRNIYNFLSEWDLATIMPLGENGWGYGRNGKDIFVSAVSEEEFRKYTGKAFAKMNKDDMSALIKGSEAMALNVDEYYNRKNNGLTSYEFFYKGLGGILTGKQPEEVSELHNEAYGGITKFFANVDAIKNEHCLEAYWVRILSLRNKDNINKR